MNSTCLLSLLAAMFCITAMAAEPAAAQATQPASDGLDARSLLMAGTSLFSAGEEDKAVEMFTKEPTYEQTREMVVKIAEGKLKPKSSSRMPNQ